MAGVLPLVLRTGPASLGCPNRSRRFVNHWVGSIHRQIQTEKNRRPLRGEGADIFFFLNWSG